MPDRLRVVTGDITRLAVDAVINAANETLLGGGGVDGAIHRAAGPELLAYCRTLDGCPTGQAKITPGFRLPAKHIIHTVGPVWRGGRHAESQRLTLCYRNCFRLAKEHGLRSISFPAIGCGVYGYPREEAANIAATECRKALTDDPALERVLLVAFDEPMAAVLRQAISAA